MDTLPLARKYLPDLKHHALLDEGPVSGISNMDNPKEFLAKVLKKTEGDYPFTEGEKGIIEAIRS